jgi:hypothetical protein
MKYVFGVLGVIFAVVLAIILISGGGNDKKKTDTTKRVVKVSQQNKEGTSVSVTTQGRVVGEDERRAIRIIVTQNERRLEILTGYEEAVERSQVYANTPAAYENFLIAIDRAGFNRSRPYPIKDERGVCPLQRRYIYELKEYGQELSRLWSTQCSAKQGTFAGAATTLRVLFQEQIPDYSKQIRGVKLL